MAYVEESHPVPELSRELDALIREASIADIVTSDSDLTERIADLRRRIVFSHPDLDFEKLLICANPHPRSGHMCDQYLGRHATNGEGLIVVENWRSDEPIETCITESLPDGQFHHADLSFEADRVVYSFCEDLEGNSRYQQHWIYETAIDGSWTRQLTGTERDPLTRGEGRETVVIEDWDPCYLPDGGIAFISTRAQSYGRCHGGRYVPAFLLYRMDGDGNEIQRLSYGEANEWDPAVLPDGRLVYTRWDYINRHDVVFQGLWTTHPDGTQTAHFYGSYSRSPCMTAEAQPIPGTNNAVLSTATAHHGYTNGSIMILDPAMGEDGPDPITRLTPEIPFPEAEPTQSWQTKNRAMAPWPINGTLSLCAYSENGAGGPYYIYLIDKFGGRELVYDNKVASAAMPVVPRQRPPVLPSSLPPSLALTYGSDPNVPDEGAFFVQDVYRNRHLTDENTIERGDIAAIRVNVILTQPTRDKWERGSVSNEVVKRPLGTVPVEPNGSVAFRAPANVPLQLQALDANGMAVMTMRSCVYLQPGETQTCIGCHEQRTETPPGGGGPVRIRDIKPSPGVDYDNQGFSFTRTVQPVLDQYCIDCHGLGRQTEEGRSAPRDYIFALPEATGERNDFQRMPVSYSALVSNARPRLAHRNSETTTSLPRDYFSHACPMPAMLLEGHRGVELPQEDFERIVTWLDMNCQCYGVYGCNREEQRKVDPDAEIAFRTHVADRFGEELAAQPLGALINFADVSQSRILMGPLSISQGGWEHISPAFTLVSDPAYQRMAELAAAVRDCLASEQDTLSRKEIIRQSLDAEGLIVAP
ncbi:MAG: hypothetical protein HN368_09570 [Spirochaetales bacterium]|nr:hypothetical protein [Spirochaetales bacterium]